MIDDPFGLLANIGNTGASKLLWSICDGPSDDENDPDWIQLYPLVHGAPCAAFGLLDLARDGEMFMLYCTRLEGHDGPHAAHGKTDLLAVWEEEA